MKIPEFIDDLILANQRIEAIKTLRNLAGEVKIKTPNGIVTRHKVGLSEAKDLVDKRIVELTTAGLLPSSTDYEDKCINIVMKKMDEAMNLCMNACRDDSQDPYTQENRNFIIKVAINQLLTKLK